MGVSVVAGFSIAMPGPPFDLTHMMNKIGWIGKYFEPCRGNHLGLPLTRRSFTVWKLSSFSCSGRLQQFGFNRNLHLIADHHPATFNQSVINQSEVLPVNFRRSCDAFPYVAPWILL